MVTFDDATTAERIAVHARQTRVDLPILVRSVHGQNDAALMAAGADVFPEGIEASLAFAGQLMSVLGIPPARTEAHLNAIRAENRAP